MELGTRLESLAGDFAKRLMHTAAEMQEKHWVGNAVLVLRVSFNSKWMPKYMWTTFNRICLCKQNPKMIRKMSSITGMGEH